MLRENLPLGDSRRSVQDLVLIRQLGVDPARQPRFVACAARELTHVL